MPILYDSRFSGNGWKVRLLLSQLQRPYERRVLNLAAGDARTPAFLELNPLARIPVLQLDDGSTIRESNAILFHLASGTSLLPAEPRLQAHLLQWLFFEQADHLRYFARPRFLISIARTAAVDDPEVSALRQFGEKALQVMQRQLERAAFIGGDRYSVADIALFPYTSMAGEGGYSLDAYPAILAWLDRVRAQPGFVPLLDPPAPPAG
ncbi:MAG: glutathione S-transferase family protein [Burkholderiaceae bacterium]